MICLDTLNIMQYNVFVGDLEKIEIDPNKKQIINTINPHSYVISCKDGQFKEALQSSDILLPDGSGIVMAAKNHHQKEIKKIAGSDLHKHLLKMLNEEGGRCFYMGSSDETLAKIKKRINTEYPNIKAGFYSPPFAKNFTDGENGKILDAINTFDADVLFIGMTAPKQEKWVLQNIDDLDVKIVASVGAVFDFYAGNISRSSQFWIDRHLEWLPRLLKEPNRLWKRNFVSTPLFLKDMFAYKWKIKK